MSSSKPAYIYLIVDNDDKPRYVGKSVDLAGRFCEHRQRWAGATMLVIERIEAPKKWQEREKFWIAYYRRWYALENRSPGGGGNGTEGMKFGPRPEEIRRKISAGLKGRPVSLETRQKLSKANKGKVCNPAQIGMPRSDDVRRKIRLGNLGRVVSQESRNKLSASLQAKRADGWEPRLGKTHDSVARSNMSRARHQYLLDHPEEFKKCSDRGRAGAKARWGG